MATRTYQRYPAMRYHKTLAPDGKEVKNAAQAAELGEGWVRTPAAFAPGYVELPEPEDGSPIDEILAAGKEPIPYPAMRYTCDGKECVVQNKEQDDNLDPAISEPVEPLPEPPARPRPFLGVPQAL